MISQNKPNFLVVGAIKCGTTSLSYYLKHHPQVFFSSPKEPHFLVRDLAHRMNFRTKECPWSICDSFEGYLELFKNCAGAKAIGEGSTYYLSLWRHVIPKIKEFLGDPKIIICVRNPVERAYAHYDIVRHRYNSTPSFEELCESPLHCPELDSIFGENRIIHQGRYADQIRAYKENFKDVHIVLLEDLRKKPKETMSRIFRFLEVSEEWMPNLGVKVNRGGDLRFPRFHVPLRKAFTFVEPALMNVVGQQATAKLRQGLGDLAYKRSSIPDRAADQLLALYLPEIASMEKLLGRELPEWRLLIR